MTKMIEEKSARLAPRESGVVLPGQSHISRGMTVLGHVERGSRDGALSDVLVSVFGRSGCGFEIEGLLRGYVVE